MRKSRPKNNQVFKKFIEKHLSTRDDFRNYVKNNEFEVEFIKKDGTRRILKGTLDFNSLPEEIKSNMKESKIEKEKSKEELEKEQKYVIVFDLEKKEFRSFIINSLVSLKIKNII